jgi:hypothetical protein
VSQPRFLADEDFRGDIIAAVGRTEPALVFSTVQELGMRGADDSIILEYAFQNDFIVVSHDRNTMTAAAYDRVNRGVHFSGLFIVEQTARWAGSSISPVDMDGFGLDRVSRTGRVFADVTMCATRS